MIRYEVYKELIDPGKITAQMRQEFLRAMYKSCLFVEGELIKASPVGATSMLRGSWTHEVIETPHSIEGNVFSHGVLYTPFVEEGTKPHWPPASPIEYWVKRKIRPKAIPFSTKPSAKKRRKTMEGKGFKFRSPKQRGIERVAGAIRKRISEVGTKAQRFVDKTAKKVKPRIDRFFDEAHRNGANV